MRFNGGGALLKCDDVAAAGGGKGEGEGEGVEGGGEEWTTSLEEEIYRVRVRARLYLCCACLGGWCLFFVSMSGYYRFVPHTHLHLFTTINPPLPPPLPTPLTRAHSQEVGEPTLCMRAELPSDPPTTTTKEGESNAAETVEAEVLLRTRVLLKDTYQRQGDSIITWCEPFLSSPPSIRDTLSSSCVVAVVGDEDMSAAARDARGGGGGEEEPHPLGVRLLFLESVCVVVVVA